MKIYGPIGNPLWGATDVCSFESPGGAATICGDGANPGAYAFQAISGSSVHQTVEGGSATCGLPNPCWGSATLLLPPRWVKAPLRGGPPQPPNGPDPPCSGAGNPVDVVTGNVWLDQTDARVPGVRTTLALKRSYNSALRLSPGREFGRGWTHGYENQITHPSDAGAPDPLKYLTLTLGDGRPLYFQEDPAVALKFVALVPRAETSYIVQSVGPTTYTRHFPDGSSEVYNAAGRLISIADSVGITTQLTYDSSTGRLVTIGDPIGGRTLTLGYPNGTATRATTLTGPAGLIATYTYTGDLLTGIEYADGDGDSLPDGGFTFVYADPNVSNALSEVRDRDGKTLERHAYYTNGKGKTSEVGPAATPSEKFTLEYIHPGALTRVTDGRGNVTEYRYGSVAGLPQVWRIQGPCAGCPGGGHQTQEWQYDEFGRITRYIDGEGNPTEYTYVTHGLQTETRWPDPLLLTNTHVTSYTYYTDGRMHTRTEPNGAVTTFTYLPAGPETITETITSTINRVTAFSYTTNGKLQFVIDPRGKDWEFHFSTKGDLEWTKDPLGFQTTYQHDLMGRVTRTIPPTTTPAIQSSIYLYDTLGRVRRITNPVDSTYTEFTYDGGGRRTKLKDPRDTVTDYEYDLHGRLSKIKNVRPGLSTLETEYGYDVMSNLTSIKDPRLKTTIFEYDGYNRVEKVIYPGATAPFERYTYNNAGMLETRQDRNGVTTTFWYDGLGRLKRKDYSDSTPDLVFGYDARGEGHKGRLTSAGNGHVSLQWTYDLAGQLLEEAASRATGSPSTVAYTYYVDGSRETLTLNGTQRLRYTYDDRGLPELTRRLPLGTGDFVFTHDAASRRSALTLPTTVPQTRTDYTYDNRSRLASLIASRNSVPIGEFTYPLYDASDNRLSRGGSTAPAEAYHYDDVYRLDWVKRGVPFSETYSFDNAGNRLASIPFPTPDWSYGDRNELLAYGGDISLGYDNNGNLTSKTEASPADAWTYEWDVENRLKRVTRNGAQVATYNYDPLGRRNQRDLGTILYTYVYDGEDVVFQDFTSVIMEENMIDPPPHFYIHGPGIDEPLAVEHGNGAVWYYHSDGQGSVVRMTDSGGTIRQSRQYDAFGNLESGSSFGEGYAYTGREWDPETGLYYYRARYYDPKIGRFISEDPLGFMVDVNFYPYVANNPTNATDPSGMVPGVGLPPGSCALIAYQVFKESPGFSRNNGRRNHCLVSCQIAQQCGKAQSFLAGHLKEAADIAWCAISGRGCFGAGQGDDYNDNAQGRACPAGVSCEDHCSGPEFEGPGAPGPFTNWGPTPIWALE